MIEILNIKTTVLRTRKWQANNFKSCANLNLQDFLNCAMVEFMYVKRNTLLPEPVHHSQKLEG